MNSSTVHAGEGQREANRFVLVERAQNLAAAFSGDDEDLVRHNINLGACGATPRLILCRTRSSSSPEKAAARFWARSTRTKRLASRWPSPACTVEEFICTRTWSLFYPSIR